jgi:hypothetical protein
MVRAVALMACGLVAAFPGEARVRCIKLGELIRGSDCILLAHVDQVLTIDGLKPVQSIGRRGAEPGCDLPRLALNCGVTHLVGQVTIAHEGDTMILSTEDAARFFRLMWGLQFFVSQQCQLLSDVNSLEEFATLRTTAKVKARDAVWENPVLIDAYVEKNPEGLSAEELDIIRKWKRFVAGKFSIFRYLKEYAIFMGNAQVYGVLGLYDRFEDVLSGRPLPILVEAVLLPYKGKIIYDGLLRPYDIHFGAGIRSGLREEYLTAKQNGRIVTSLEPETPPGKPTRQQRALDKGSEAALAEMVRMSEKLRGGTVIQSAALGLLRASAKAAQSAAQNSDDLEELRLLGRQVQNALNRLHNVLERAEQ